VEEFLNSYIATQIKVLREERGWSQQRLATESGMKQERISVLEDVGYSSWTINTLRKLAWAFDLRLRVSFETFSSGIEEIRSFSSELLKRASREDDLSFAQSIQANWIYGTATNQPFDATSPRAEERSRSLIDITQTSPGRPQIGQLIATERESPDPTTAPWSGAYGMGAGMAQQAAQQ
jgi:transcriptional regulator with XRE-family HTH domain